MDVVSPHKAAARCRALARQGVLGISLAILCPSAWTQALYQLRPIGVLASCAGVPVAAGFNGPDQGTGYACDPQGSDHAFLWKNDGSPLVDLGPPEAGSYSEGVGINTAGVAAGYAVDSTGQFGFTSSGNGAPMKRIYDTLGGNAVYVSAINDPGQLTGYADTPTGGHAFLWTNNGSPLADLGTLGGDASYGYAINATGQVAGLALTAKGASHAFIWKNDGTPMHDLGTLGGGSSQAFAINASGQVTGWSNLPANKNTGSHAFFWRNNGTPMQDLGTLGGDYSYPTAFNQSGQVAGYSYTQDSVRPHAFVWLNNGTAMKDLGTLGGYTSRATDMNASGLVVGWAEFGSGSLTHAFLWKNNGGKILDLNTLIDSADPLQPYIMLTKAYFINHRSDILAEGVDSRNYRAGLYVLRGTVLTMTPRSVAFGNQKIHTASAAKSVTVTNTSAKSFALTSIALTGSAPGQFAFTDNCGASLAGHAACTIKVTFKPTTLGAKSAAVSVNKGDGGLTSVSLSGTGT